MTSLLRGKGSPKLLLKGVLLLLLCCIEVSGGVACRDKDCEHKKYGHRRARLEEPIIRVPTAGGEPSLKSYDVGNYFKDVEEMACLLRRHLIRDGAFEAPPFSGEDVFVRRVIRETHQAITEDALVLKLQDESVNLGSLGDRLRKDKDYHKTLLKRINKGIQKAIEETSQNARNIASFGFVFFDKNGLLINRVPFHFSPDEGHDLGIPFFFLSGRRHRDYIPGQDPSPWTALPETAPKQEDTRLISAPVTDMPKALGKTFSDVLSEDRQADLERLLKIYRLSLESYDSSLRTALREKTTKEPFFQYGYSRKKRVQRENVCPEWFPLLELSVLPLPSLREGQSEVIYPTERKDEVANCEGDFTHSEQYALFKMSSTFDKFMDRCILAIAPSLHSGTEGGAQSRVVSSYAVLIYSYNVMCVRCAQSVIIDFIHAGEIRAEDGYKAFDRTIASKLTPQRGEGQNPSSVFIAGYTRPYKSELYDFTSDRFEESMRPSTGEAAAALPEDETFKPLPFCTPEESPQMIYHVDLSGVRDLPRPTRE